MRYRTILSTLTAAAMIVAPTSAIAQSAPLPAPAEETGAQLGGDDDDNGILLWLLLGGGVAAAIYFLLIRDDEDEAFPTSP